MSIAFRQDNYGQQVDAEQSTTSPSAQPRRPRILHVIGSSGFGGASIFVSRLARFTREQGYDVDVLTTDPKLQSILRSDGIGIVDLDVIWREIRPWKDLRGARTLAKFLKSADYDVVHTHTSKGGIVGRWAAWKARVPAIIHTVHGFAFHEESSKPKLWLYSFLERMAAKWCHRIVTVSEYHRDWARQLGIGKSNQVVAIPNGVGTETGQPTKSADDVRAELGVDADTFLMLAPGRLAPQKGLAYLVQATKTVQEQASLPFQILLAGEGPLKDELQYEAKRLGVESNIRFLGYRDDVPDLLAASDVVVLPSLWEGLSLALLEAMMMGKPVISTEIGSNLEVCRKGNAIRLVPPKDSSALAEAMLEMIESPEQRFDLAESGQQIAQQHYSEARMMQRYQDLYAELTEAEPSTDSRVSDQVASLRSDSYATPGYVRSLRIDPPNHRPGKLNPPRYLGWKTIAERTVAFLSFVVFLPVIALLILAVRLASPGPGIYRQKRVGKDGRTFTLYKLRSMRCDAETNSGPVWAKTSDPRVTWLGKILRDTHLDELPQLWNVACGEMSFVGPRPERPEFVTILEKSIPNYLDRLEVLPGITGLAQVNLPPDSDNESVWRKLLVDREYIAHASFSMDVRIVVLTLLRMIGLRGPRVRNLFGLYISPEVLPPLPDTSPTPNATFAAKKQPVDA